ncbi:MAG: hypothetical protein KAR42_04920 [candidate division Zixibacteria bacterium]|nr:hypothetical protein [candidate division Zixibacteria bacterium]
MLSFEEKSYCRALEALRKKDYITADKEFEACKSLYVDSAGIKIISEAVRTLVALRDEKKKLEKREITIQETVNHGEEAIVCGQGQQEESG